LEKEKREEKRVEGKRSRKGNPGEDPKKGCWILLFGGRDPDRRGGRFRNP
jgi:hypothetical protein